ncbi:hypothetical protein BH23CHL8_BH23CHL8_31440 [soil metagenome]
MNDYVMNMIANDRSHQLLGEAAQARLARRGRAERPARRRAADRAQGVRGQIALLLGRSSAA